MSLEDLTPEARDELAALSRQLAENPNTRKDFLRLTKKVKPDMPIPELEIEDATNAATSQMRGELESLRNQMREKDAIEELNRRRSKLKAKGLIESDEDIEHVEKVMLEKGITNHEAAAEYWSFMKQAATPTPTGYNPSAIKGFNLDQFWKNPVQGARNEAAAALNELRRNPKPIGL
jgi:hypothetical protein